MHLALTPDKTALVQWIIFILCFIVLHWGIFLPTLKIMAARKAKTSDLRHRAQDLEKQSEKMTIRCEEKIQEARNEGLKKRTAKILLGANYRDEQLKKVRTEVDHQMEKLRLDVEKSSQEAHAQLSQSVREIASQVASKILEREVQA